MAPGRHGPQGSSTAGSRQQKPLRRAPRPVRMCGRTSAEEHRQGRIMETVCDSRITSCDLARFGSSRDFDDRRCSHRMRGFDHIYSKLRISGAAPAGSGTSSAAPATCRSGRQRRARSCFRALTGVCRELGFARCRAVADMPPASKSSFAASRASRTLGAFPYCGAWRDSDQARPVAALGPL